MSKHRKLSRKIAKYGFIGGASLFVIATLFVAFSEQEEKEQRVAETKVKGLERAAQMDPEKLVRDLRRQAEEAKRVREQQLGKPPTGKPDSLAPSSPPVASVEDRPMPSPAVDLDDRLPDAPPPPPGKKPLMRVFDEEKKRAAAATTMPDIFDETAGSGSFLPKPASQKNSASQESGTDAKGHTVSGGTKLDKSWKSPPSPVILPKKAPSEYLIQAGSVIDVVLLNDVNTQNPGRIQFRVVSDVYDSLGNRRLLIPKGAKLLGRYGRPPNFGLDRVPITVERVLFSDGRSVTLKDFDISDAMGTLGAPAEFHSNIWRAIGPAALVAWIGYKVDEALAGKGQTTTTPSGTTVQQTISQATIPEIQRRILQRYGSAEPYYTIPAGKRLTIIVASDIAIPPENRN
ncbi:TrbI/VirB10 family protein [Alcanivorax sp.]|uniref:TrbI/VirB10 family protein n=1 Tax=Alcanivorax sp. TaxID=1872427 RepID=UPI002587088A|nr:TrbI/VirB10 family protein [Alcanivorax sp.]